MGQRVWQCPQIGVIQGGTALKEQCQHAPVYLHRVTSVQQAVSAHVEAPSPYHVPLGFTASMLVSSALLSSTSLDSRRVPLVLSFSVSPLS